jgi:hypothetical protein
MGTAFSTTRLIEKKSPDAITVCLMHSAKKRGTNEKNFRKETLIGVGSR